MDTPYRQEALVDSLRLRLFTAQSQMIGLWWDAADVQSNYWRFYRNDSDGACLELPEGPYPLEGGRLYLVPAGVRFACRCTREVEHLFIHFDIVGLPPIAMRELFGRPICLPEAPAMEATAREMARGLAAGKPVDPAFQCRIKALLYEGLARYLESVPVAQKDHTWQWLLALRPILPAIRYLEENLPAPLSNRELARLCHLSEDYFTRRFRECTGETPGRYILNRRLTTAAQCLRFTDQSIEQIAAETGFGNRFYFSRMFSRQVGMPPAAYRKTARV